MNLKLIPTTDFPYPSVETPAGTYTWNGTELVNISVEAPSVPGQPIRTGFPFLVTFYQDGEELFSVRGSNIKDVRTLIRATIILYLGANTLDRLQYDVWEDAFQRWVDPSLDSPDYSRWPADWNGLMNAELQIKGGLGDKI